MNAPAWSDSDLTATEARALRASEHVSASWADHNAMTRTRIQRDAIAAGQLAAAAKRARREQVAIVATLALIAGLAVAIIALTPSALGIG